MKSLKKYSWLLYFISASILLALGILFIFETKVVIYLMGILFIIFGVSRLVPLFKTIYDKLMKWLFVFEIIIEVICGSVLIYIASKDNTIGPVFGYIVGGVFYIRGFMHFFATSMREEPNSLISFLFHMAILTSGVLIIANGNVNSKAVSIILAVLLFICFLFQVFKGIKEYKNYRGILVSENLTKKIKKQKQIDTVKELPTSDEISINIPEENDKIDEINA